jgi:hypothetical protein
VSQRSQDNAVVKAIKAKLEAMASDVDKLVENKRMIETLRDTSEDDRVRFNAAKLIADIEIRIIEQTWEMYEHDEPPVHKTEAKVEIDIPSKLTVEIVQPCQS